MNFADLRVLTVRQPFASLIASGKKTIELRSWSPDSFRKGVPVEGYRGPVVIHAGLAEIEGTGYPSGPKGVAVALVELGDVERAGFDPTVKERACFDVAEYAMRFCKGFWPYAWHVRIVFAFPEATAPRFSGKLGLWRAPGELVMAVRREYEARDFLG